MNILEELRDYSFLVSLIVAQWLEFLLVANVVVADERGIQM
jgi:hypothetical protein